MRKSVQIRLHLEKEFPNRTFSVADAEKIELFLEYLIKWNQKINLTGMKGFQDLFGKLILDSLAIYKLPISILEENPLAGKIIDLGSGAGIPGLVLALCDSTLNIDSVDSSRKKITFQNMVRANLKLQNVRPLNIRIETMMADIVLQNSYDCIVSRALTQIKKLCLFASFFLKFGGHLIVWKGTNWKRELEEALDANDLFEMRQALNYNFKEFNHQSTLLLLRKKQE